MTEPLAPPADPTPRPSDRRSRFSLPVPAAAFVAVALGLLALVGWVIEVPSLSSFGGELIPMAPSTAVLFVALGGILALRAGSRGSRRVDLSCGVGSGVIGLIALALLVASLGGIHSPVEYLGLPVEGEVRGAPLGHMSPITAACFLFASAALLLSQSAARSRQHLRLGAIVAAGLLLGASLVFMLAYAYGRPLFYGGAFIPPALTTVLAFAALGLGELMLLGREAPSPISLPPRLGSATAFLGVYVALSVGIVATGYYFYRSFERHYRDRAERELLAIAELRTGELTRWRRERVSDGAVFFGNDDVAEHLSQVLDRPDDSVRRERLGIWLRQISAAYRYDRVVAVDALGRELVAAPPTLEAPTPWVRAAVAECLREPRVHLLDLHRDRPGGRLHLSVLVPILSGGQARRPLGAIVLRVDPETDLFPLITHWPTASETAETILVRREGSDVLFLNPLRFEPNAPLSLRIPLTRTDLPAAMAVVGRAGIVQGIDYRGVPVLAAVRAVPDSPWFVVARQDAAEVFAPLAERLWMMALLVVTLVLGAGAAFAYVWRQETLRAFRERLVVAEALETSEAELRRRNDELMRFTYTVSHDLKSPLVTIQTFAGYLGEDLEKRDDQAVTKDLGFIRSAASKMAHLLDDLLALSRVGKRMNPPEDVSFQEVVDEALTLVAGRIAAHGVQVEVSPAPLILRGDRTRLVEVFQNLVDNAAKFMGDQAAPLIEIGAETVADETILFVRDNGAGIDPRHASKLFGLFEKLDPGSEGTGIGLALVRRIVEVHGGRIWAESAGLGQGACFRFTLAGSRLERGGQLG